MTDRIDSVIAELSSAADLLIAAESARTRAAQKIARLQDWCLAPEIRTAEETAKWCVDVSDAQAAMVAVDEKFLADFNPANCGHLAELIRELRDYCRSQHPCP